MTDALKKAAEEASAATGLEVVLCDPDATDEYGGPLYSVEVYDNIDGEYPDGPVIDTGLLVEPAALAYLEGHSQGAHIATVRAAALAREYIGNDDSYGEFAGELWPDALAELEA